MKDLDCENIFIFNFNDNNTKNIELLKRTFSKFNCIVKHYEKLKKSEILAAAEEISKKNFTLFEYIVTIILDNRNKAENVIRSSDECDVFLHSEFLTKILENRTLINKKLLFLLQINRNFPSDDDEEEIAKRKMKNNSVDDNNPIYASSKVYFYAVETSQVLPMENELFIESFCKHFSEYGNKLGIDKIHGKICSDLERNNYDGIPVLERHFQTEDRIFGKALSDDDLKVFYSNAHEQKKSIV